MSEAGEIRQLLDRKFQKKQNRIGAIPGQMGNGYGVLAVPGREGYYYVRVAGTVNEVFNNRVGPQNDLLVLVGYDPLQPDLFQVLSTRTVLPGSEGGINGMGYAPAIRYQWMAPGGGQDPLFVELRQFLHLRIGANGTMKLQVYRGVVWTGTAFVLVDKQEIDLSAYRPADLDRAALVLATIDETGQVIVTKGTEYVEATATTPALLLAQIPSIPTKTRYVLGFVRLYARQTALQEARTNTDIIDLRFSGWSAGGGEGSANDPTTEIGDMIYRAPKLIISDNVISVAKKSLGASSTASSEFDVQPAASLVDDTLVMPATSAWSSATPDLTHWVRVDLGVARTIVGYHIHQNETLPYRATEFDIETSADDVDWTLAEHVVWDYDYYMNGIGGNPTSFDYRWELTTPKTARYWRFTRTAAPTDPPNYWQIFGGVDTGISLFAAEVIQSGLERLPVGADGKILTVVNGLPTWETAPTPPGGSGSASPATKVLLNRSFQ
jgi:hypothetical protein